MPMRSWNKPGYSLYQHEFDNEVEGREHDIPGVSEVPRSSSREVGATLSIATSLLVCFWFAVILEGVEIVLVYFTFGVVSTISSVFDGLWKNFGPVKERLVSVDVVWRAKVDVVTTLLKDCANADAPNTAKKRAQNLKGFICRDRSRIQPMLKGWNCLSKMLNESRLSNRWV